MMGLYLLLLAILGVCGFVAWKLMKPSDKGNDAQLIEDKARLTSQLEQKIGEVGKLNSLMSEQESQKNEWKGKYGQLFAENANVKSDYKVLVSERDTLKRQLATTEADEKRKEKELDSRFSQLTKAEETLKEERQRVIREDEERLKRETEEKDRLWTMHENNVISILTDLCKLPQFGFTHYTNTNLPEGFDGSLKPDFMIEFLDEYVIFDAKVSKAKSLQTYITDAVKSTVQKVKKNPKIHPHIFLVVPSEGINELKSHYYPVDGYSLYVVSPEALSPILSCLKRITTYEFAEQMDPRERENIISLLAEMDFHINMRNGVDLMVSKMGTNILEKARTLDPALAAEVAIKTQEMTPKISATDLKKLVGSITLQNQEIQDLASPKASVKQKYLDAANSVIMEKLL